MDVIINILDKYGLPIAVIAALMWYIIYKDKAHAAESKAVTEALDKNTAAMIDMRLLLAQLMVRKEEEDADQSK